MGVLFQISSLGLTVGGQVLLQSVSASLEAGRVYGLIGHNGSGKSTLLRLLSGQLAPSEGSITFEGRAIERWPRRALARRVAFLPQHPSATTGMTVRELVALGRYPWHGALGRFGADDRNKVAVALAAMEVDGLAERLVDSLSGGERQRAWLAALVAQNASCLLLDEPTSALDIGHQLRVLSLVRRLAEEGATVVVVLHDLNMAARFCDEFLALHTGQLVLQGNRDALMTAEALERIYDVPMAVLDHPAGGAPIGIAL